MISLRTALVLVGVAAGAVLVGLPALSCSAPDLGPVAGRLRPCPSSPNCVGSQDPDPDHRVEPLRPPGPAETALTRLRAVLAGQPRVELLESTDVYLHAVFISRWLRFRDDVEFLLDPATGVIQVRSASRVGWSDLGANRARIERLRALLEE